MSYTISMTCLNKDTIDHVTTDLEDGKPTDPAKDVKCDYAKYTKKSARISSDEYR